MRSVLFPGTALVLLTFCSPSHDRRGETGMANGAGGFSAHDTMPSAATDTASTGAAATGGAVTTPASILSQLYLANTMEIQLSKLATKKAVSPKVKQVAAKLVSDHTGNREQAEALAQKLNISLTPPATGTDSAALPPALQGKSGAEFDKAYVQHEIQEHQTNIDKIQNQLLPAAQDDQIKAYLRKTLPEMQRHLASLQAVQKKLGS